MNPFSREEESREICEVNVVPLADVSLVLLILLMVLSPMMTPAALRIQAAARAEQPPETPPQPPAPEPEPEPVLAVALTPEGGISVGQRSFATLGDFTTFITEELRARKDRKVFLSPHPDVAHGRVVHMLETLKYCGASDVALVQTQEPAP